MATKRIKCRTHGGYFVVEARRGRPPVKCTEDNECDAAKIPAGKPQRSNPKAVAALTAQREAAQSKMPTSAARTAPANASGTAERASWVEARKATVAEVNRIWMELGVQGWTAKRGWLDDSVHSDITATRGDEMLYIVVTGGKVIQQQYSLWHFEKPSLNGKPTHNLPFDPDEIGDGELARYLVGAKVTWYNRLSGKEETAYCGKESIRIEHGYSATGDEIPGERVIKFVDADRLNFRAFRLDALLKVGK